MAAPKEVAAAPPRAVHEKPEGDEADTRPTKIQKTTLFSIADIAFIRHDRCPCCLKVDEFDDSPGTQTNPRMFFVVSPGSRAEVCKKCRNDLVCELNCMCPPPPNGKRVHQRKEIMNAFQCPGKSRNGLCAQNLHDDRYSVLSIGKTTNDHQTIGVVRAQTCTEGLCNTYSSTDIDSMFPSIYCIVCAPRNLRTCVKCQTTRTCLSCCDDGHEVAAMDDFLWEKRAYRCLRGSTGPFVGAAQQSDPTLFTCHKCSKKEEKK
jgi:hypothetical protein